MKRATPSAVRLAKLALTTGFTIGLLGACDAAEGVRVERLPPLERPTAETRAGLAEITGTWHFAGWEVSSPGVLEALGEPPLPGDLVVETQRVDSLAGYLIRGELVLPFSGELRRDGVVSLLTLPDTLAQSPPRFAAGRLLRDTLWIELTTLPAGNLSPPTQRWAFFRGMVGQPFLRLPTGQLLRDTVVALAPEPAVAPGPRPAAPDEAGEPAAPPPARPAPREEPAAPRRQPEAPRAPRDQEPADTPPAPRQPQQVEVPPPPSPQIDIPPLERR